MRTEADFYSSGQGDRLIDPVRYPKEVEDYLVAEERLIASLADQFDLLFEVGCMAGRYLGWALKGGKRYLGIDIVERYVKEGQARLLALGFSPDKYRIEVCDAARPFYNLFNP